MFNLVLPVSQQQQKQMYCLDFFVLYSKFHLRKTRDSNHGATVKLLCVGFTVCPLQLHWSIWAVS